MRPLIRRFIEGLVVAALVAGVAGRLTLRAEAIAPQQNGPASPAETAGPPPSVATITLFPRASTVTLRGGESVTIKATLVDAQGAPLVDESRKTVNWTITSSSGADVSSLLSPLTSTVGEQTKGLYGSCTPTPDSGEACTMLAIPPGTPPTQTLTISAAVINPGSGLVRGATTVNTSSQQPPPSQPPAPPVVAPPAGQAAPVAQPPAGQTQPSLTPAGTPAGTPALTGTAPQPVPQAQQAQQIQPLEQARQAPATSLPGAAQELPGASGTPGVSAPAAQAQTSAPSVETPATGIAAVPAAPVASPTPPPLAAPAAAATVAPPPATPAATATESGGATTGAAAAPAAPPPVPSPAARPDPSPTAARPAGTGAATPASSPGWGAALLSAGKVMEWVIVLVTGSFVAILLVGFAGIVWDGLSARRQAQQQAGEPEAAGEGANEAEAGGTSSASAATTAATPGAAPTVKVAVVSDARFCAECGSPVPLHTGNGSTTTAAMAGLTGELGDVAAGEEAAPPQNLREWVLQGFGQPGTQAYRLTQLVVLVLIYFSVATVMLDSIPELHQSLERVFQVAEIITVTLFTLEYAANVYAAKDRRAYIFSVWSIIDLLAIIPTILALLDLRVLRIIRTVRLLRMLRMLRMLRVLKLVKTLRGTRQAGETTLGQDLQMYFVSVFSVVMISATLVYYAEGEIEGTAFPHIPAALWWSVTTITGVGYGGVFPETAGGRAIAVLTMFAGLALFAMLVSIVGRAMARSDESGLPAKNGRQALIQQQPDPPLTYSRSPESDVHTPVSLRG